MEADFSGWATKAGLKCSDGKTIASGAFKDQDKMRVPLVWQHNHDSPEHVLGHSILENREEGVYAYCFFNNSPKAQEAKELVRHGDVSMMSIWANQLVQRAGRVLHGAIREVSLVLSGANPGAVIESITLQHSDGSDEILDDEAIIKTGEEVVVGGEITLEEDVKHDNTDSELTVQDVVETMSDDQKETLYFLVGQALEHDDVSEGEAFVHASTGSGPTIQDVVDSMSDQQKQVLYFLVGQAVDGGDSLKQDSMGEDTGSDDDAESKDDEGEKDDDAQNGEDDVKHDDVGDDKTNDQKGTNEIMNVFEGDSKTPSHVLSHADKAQLLADATKTGSLKEAVEAYASEHLQHGIEDIDILFPEAQAITTTPEFFARRMEWVNIFLSGVTKRPFSRIKTQSADLTLPEARAKGYVKGAMKKEEFFRVTKRVTTPTTIYKKQKLDRDDMIDITDFDVVAWLKGEMRVMLDEEIARAALVGDGRDGNDEDKISEDNIRPIASDDELYTIRVNVNLLDAASSIQEFHDAVIMNRQYYRGSGTLTMFTTETVIGQSLLLRDGQQRKIYTSLDALATDLRVSQIVSVEALNEHPDVVAILVDLRDYSLGADRGGAVSMFDDFDIDYNQYKYLIETRCSGALTKLRSAMVFHAQAGTDTLVTPAEPTFDGTNVVIHDTANVVYRNADTDAVITNAGGPYAVDEGETFNVHAEPTAGHYVASSEVNDWAFRNDG
jgi:HK97 family phage prohead protease